MYVGYLVEIYYIYGLGLYNKENTVLSLTP